ncbi:MYB DNA-binding domain protein [Neofusicoccum parvum]|nr:MYB DNA-binding domain protein [Neofusicoccum parvum]
MALKPDIRCAYKVVGDCTIHVDIYVPQTPPAGKTKCPVALAIHGGAFILGHSDMVNKDQIADCLSRGWLVLSLDHRLCPQVDILTGPITDCRDALAWVHSGGLAAALAGAPSITADPDLEHVVAWGTSSGGTLALALGWGVRRPPCAILDFYGATRFEHRFWRAPVATARLPPDASAAHIDRVYDEAPVPTRGGVSLEGQAPASSTTSSTTMPPRPSFAFAHIARGTLLDVCFPSADWATIDATLNVTPAFPPTCIVHGTADTMVPEHLSRALYAKLEESGVRREFIEVPGEEHTFVGKMVKGSEVWDRQRRGFDFLEEVISGGKQ